MYKYLLILTFLSVNLFSADATPENLKLINEIYSAKELKAQFNAMFKNMAENLGNEEVEVVKSKFEKNFDAQYKNYLQDLSSKLLKKLSNEELKQLYAIRSKPEYASVSLKAVSGIGESVRIVYDEALYIVGQLKSRTHFEIENPWPDIPPKRRDAVKKIIPLLLAQSSEIPSKASFKSGLEDEFRAQKISLGSPEAQNVLKRADEFNFDRITNSLEESLCRRLTTHEAEWYLSLLQNDNENKIQQKVEAIEKSSAEIFLK